MSEGIEEIARVLSRYEVIERLYLSPTVATNSSDLQLLQACVTRVYTIILRYLAKATKFWTENTAKRMAKALITTLEAEHNDLQSALRRADDESYRMVSLVKGQQATEGWRATSDILERMVDDSQMPIVRMAQSVSEINDKLDKAQRREVLRWLSTVPCESQHQETAAKIVKGTGQWLLESPELLDWQRSSVSSIFWLRGAPGVGKSKLTSLVIESFMRQYEQESVSPPPLAYFYCSRKGTDPRSRNHMEILYSLLRQLTGRDVQLPLRGSVAREYERRKGLFDGAGAQIPRMNMEETVKHILEIAAEDPITIVVDALDEIDEAERGDLFRSLETIRQGSLNVAKIFVSSRNDGDIFETFEQNPGIAIEERMNGNDGSTFAALKVQEAIRKKRLLRGRVSPSLQDEIVATLIQGAHGM